MNKKAIKSIIEQFADKTLRRGMEIFYNVDSGVRGYGNVQCIKSVCEPLDEISLYGQNLNPKIHTIREKVTPPVMLTDVLFWMGKKRGTNKLKLVRLWEDCGIKRSLQEIAEDGFEVLHKCECGKSWRGFDMSDIFNDPCYDSHHRFKTEQLKEPALSLFTFLTSLTS